MKHKHNIISSILFAGLLSSCCHFEWDEKSCLQVNITGENATIWKDRKVCTLEQYQKDDDKSSYARCKVSYGLYNSYGKWSLYENCVDISHGIHSVRDYENISEEDLKTLLDVVEPMNRQCPTHVSTVKVRYQFEIPADHVLCVKTPYKIALYYPENERNQLLKKIFYMYRNIAKKYGDVLPISNEYLLSEDEMKL